MHPRSPTRRQSQRHSLSRRVLAHASRHRASWLIFDVRPPTSFLMKRVRIEHRSGRRQSVFAVASHADDMVRRLRSSAVPAVEGFAAVPLSAELRFVRPTCGRTFHRASFPAAAVEKVVPSSFRTHGIHARPSPSSPLPQPNKAPEPTPGLSRLVLRTSRAIPVVAHL